MKTVKRVQDRGVRQPRYFTKPSIKIVDAFLQHVLKTGEPETFPTIEVSPPSKDCQPTLLASFDVDRKKRRDGQLVPCPICSPSSPKYGKGYLVWFPDDGSIRAIGTECGGNYFNGDTFTQMRDVAAKERQQADAENFVEKNLRFVAELNSNYTLLIAACRHVDTLHSRLRRDAPQILRKLSEVTRAGGMLKTASVREATQVGPAGLRTSSSRLEVSEREFGLIPDCCLFRVHSGMEKKAVIAQRRLEHLPTVPDEEAAFYWMCGTGAELKHLEEIQVWMKQAAKDYLRLRSMVFGVSTFFDKRVFNRLNSWGQSAENDFSLEAYVANDGFQLTHIKGSDSVFLRPNIVRLGELPEFSHFS